jgi:hypothetical protein
MTGVAQQIFDDLLTLEVNTIVKVGVTARKMPEAPHALLDIVGDYDTWICQLARRIEPTWVAFRTTRPATDFVDANPQDWLVEAGQMVAGVEAGSTYSGDEKVTAKTFDDLRERARKLADQYKLLVSNNVEPDDGSSIVLKRIYRNADQIKAILEGRRAAGKPTNEAMRQAGEQGFSRHTAAEVDLPLTSDEILIIRKAWEIGTETVLMQTVIQLDGDIITRMQRDRAVMANANLHEIHRSGVDEAMKHWGFLVDTLMEMAGKAGRFLARSS